MALLSCLEFFQLDLNSFTCKNCDLKIAWSQALPINVGENNVGLIMRNVLDAFLKEGPLPGSKYVGDEKHWR